ncbi:glycosyltransferase family 2 protein [Neolewinella antarctica]|uniref:Glycosyltransferase involved in cell wall biosynthesis n=1 Tax=Neolewinella antarctica TaxID=442734 RepID=A0ABX0XFR0_9BACT|nr:glycosyltransferase family 2 protein [Neolewinella antarctica]NJC27739.1 glycosyltransferase involved in cell wall biosynthesis [Neolewinella antarctica]
MSNRAPQLLSIVIPMYNEEATLVSVLDKIAGVDLIASIKTEIVVVDDCSTDASLRILQDYMMRYPDRNIRNEAHRMNQGKGAALRTGIRAASGDYIIIQDADLEYNPEEFNLLLQPVVDGLADVVYGSRFIGGKPHWILFFWHSIGNKVLTFLCNAVANLNLTDMETCYKLFPADVLKSIDIKENRFGFEPEVTIKMSAVPNIRIYEVGISYYGRTYAEGKKISYKDGFRAIYCILKYGVFK